MINKRLPKKLKNTPLVDALFEVRFESPVPASSVLPGLLLARMGEPFKEVERLATADIPVQIRKDNPALRYQPLLRLHLGNFLIPIGDASLSVSCRMPYPGWHDFSKEILKIFNQLKNASIIKSIERYSIKYTNVIDGKTLAEQIQKIDMSLKIGNHSLCSENFGIRLEISQDKFIQLVHIAGPAQTKSVDGRARNGVLLDIDTILNHQTTDIDKFIGELPVRLEEIHTACKTMFFACLTAQAIDDMEPIYE
jgi:uncharacterized protein (TIGR04255 family)